MNEFYNFLSKRKTKKKKLKIKKFISHNFAS